MYARQNNIKITFPIVIDGVRIKSVQWLAGQSQQWLNDNGITLHDDPIKPDYDPETQKITMGDDGEYQVEDLLLDQAKQNKRNKINSIRDEKLRAGFEYNGNVFDSDEKSIQRITGVFTFALADPEFTSNFITKDNKTVTLSNAECKGLGQAAGIHEQTLVFTARQLKDAIIDAKTIDELKSISWSE